MLISCTVLSINSGYSVNAKQKPPKETAGEHPSQIISHLYQQNHRENNQRRGPKRIISQHISSLWLLRLSMLRRIMLKKRPWKRDIHRIIRLAKSIITAYSPFLELWSRQFYRPGHRKESRDIDKKLKPVLPRLRSTNLPTISTFIHKFLLL